MSEMRKKGLTASQPSINGVSPLLFMPEKIGQFRTLEVRNSARIVQTA